MQIETVHGHAIALHRQARSFAARAALPARAIYILLVVRQGVRSGSPRRAAHPARGGRGGAAWAL